MIACPSCGAENVEGTRFCVKCGTTLPATPAPESWRQSGDLGQQQTQQPGYQPGGYSTPQTPSSSYPGSYTPQQGMSYQQAGGGADWQAAGANKKMAAGLCGILLGGLGVHKFILGRTGQGLIMLLLSCTFFLIPAMAMVGFVEGVIYLTRTDEDFYRIYVRGRRGWF